MKILAVTQYYWPESFQVTTICEELAARGHEVTVLTGLPNYPSGTIPKEYRRGRNRRQRRNGVDIVRAPLIARGKNPLRLALNYHSFAWAATRASRSLEDDFDVVFVHEISPVTMVEPAAAYKKRCGAPLLVYCCDLWPESLKTILGERGKPIVGLYRKVSKRLYDAADLIAVQSTAFPEYLHEVHGIPYDKMTYLPQFADDEYLDKDFSAPHDGINFMIMGNMGRAQDIPVVLRAVELMEHDEGFKVHFVGDGSCFEETKEHVRKKGLDDRVVLHGRRPYEEMERYYSIADACILTLNGDTWVGTTLPSRLQGYMAAGKPVLAAINGGARAVIEESGCGQCVDAGDSKGLAGLMDGFIQNGKTLKFYETNGRSYFKRHFSQEKHVSQIEDMLMKLHERNRCAQR